MLSLRQLRFLVVFVAATAVTPTLPLRKGADQTACSWGPRFAHRCCPRPLIRQRWLANSTWSSPRM